MSNQVNQFIKLSDFYLNPNAALNFLTHYNHRGKIKKPIRFRVN